MGPEDTEEQVPQGDAQPAGEPTAPEQQSPVTGQPAAPTPQAAPIQPTPQQVQQVQQAQLQNARTSHLSQIGQMVLGAMGKDVNYSIDPQTGQTVTSVTPQKPGELFRRILAGALVGGAVGGQDARNAGGSPLAGAVGGAGAAQAQIQQQDQQKQADAQQQFKNQQAAAKDQQDQTQGDLNQQLLKAQIAHANLGTLQLNQLTQGKDYDTHVARAEAGKANVAPYEDAGLKPVFDSIPEADMQKTIQNNPGASALDWEPVGMHETEDADGTHHFQYQYSAYDPKGKVPLSAVTLAAWKKDGFLDTLGSNAADVLQPDKQLDASQFIALKNKHTQYQVQQETDRQHTQAVAMDAAKLAAEQALGVQRAASADASEARARKGAGGAPAAGGGQSISGLTPDEYQGIIDLVGSGRADAGSLLRYGKAAQTKILSDVAQKYPDFDMTTYQTRLGVAKSFASGKDAANAQSFNTLIGHIGDLSSGVDAIRNSGSPLINKPMNELKNITGNPQVTQLMAQIVPVRTEFLNFLNNNHALSEADKADGRALLNEDMSPAQFQGEAKQFMGTAAIRLQALNNKYKNTMGKNAPNLISPESQSALRNAGYGNAVDDITGAPKANPPVTPQTHTFSQSAWQKANPKGDLNAAIAYAQHKQYRVVP